MKRNTVKNPAQAPTARGRRRRPEVPPRIEVRSSHRAEGGGWRRLAHRIRPAKSTTRNGACLCLFIVLSLAGILSARYGSSAASPVNRGTVPPSSYRSALVGTPSPVDNTGNSLVTGNVGGGKAFRGNIPYSSTTSFSAPLGTTSLDPFLRYSAVPEELGEGPSGYTPFHSPTGTVSKMQPGASGVFAPGSPKVAVGTMQYRPEQPADLTAPAEVPFSQVSAGRMTDARLGEGTLSLLGRSQTAPESIAPQWSRTPDEMQRLVAGAPGGPATERVLTPQSKQIMTSEEYQRQLDQLQQDFDRVKTNASQFEQDLRAGKQTPSQVMEPRAAEPVRPMISADALRRIIQPQSQPQDQSSTANPAVSRELSANSPTLAPDGSATLTQTQGRSADDSSGLVLLSPQNSPLGGRSSVTEAPRAGLYGRPSPGPFASDLAAQKSRIDAIFAPRTEGTAAGAAGDNAAKLPALQRVEETARAFNAPGQLIDHPLQGSAGTVPSSTDAARTAPSGALDGADSPGSDRSKDQGLTGTPAPAPAKPSNLDPISKDKFDRLMKSAEADMRQGRYGPAAESFALAWADSPRDARPQLGRSHALLAAGEYLGSAACLAKAIELAPRATLAASDLARSNLIEALGGPDQFVQRVTQLEERAKTSSASGLQLLLAYLYQQMDRAPEARAALQAARKGLPSSPALDLLETALSARG